MQYQVNEYQRANGELRFRCVVAGLGRNKNTWDSCHGRSAAFAHAKRLNADPHKPAWAVYRAEPQFS